MAVRIIRPDGRVGHATGAGMSAVAQYEWGILFLGLIGVLLWELRSVRREIRRDKDQRR